MQIAPSDLYIVVDHGSVVFESRSKQDAEIFLSSRGRGVLCKVLSVCVADFLHDREQTSETRKKPRRRERNN